MWQTLFDNESRLELRAIFSKMCIRGRDCHLKNCSIGPRNSDFKMKRSD